MADVDYGYEDLSGYGYGDGEPDADYGYGEAGADTDYGYGDQDLDYGYGDEEQTKPVEEEPKTRPKRRCSVTKYNLENNDALTAADRIRELRGTGEEENNPAKEESIPSSSEHDSNRDTTPKKGLLGRFRK
jgi:hypothetical protein